MSTTTELSHCIADALKVPRRTVGRFATQLRKADMLGAGGTPATAEYATNLLLGVLGSGRPQESSRTARHLSGMRLVDVNIKHITAGGISSESVAGAVMDRGELPNCFLSPFGSFLSAVIADYQSGEFIGSEFRPTSLMVSQCRPLAILEFHAHPNFCGGVAFGEAVYAGAADGDTKGALERGEWPPDLPQHLPQLETLAVIPGSVFEALADVLNEAEERACKSERTSEPVVVGAA